MKKLILLLLLSITINLSFAQAGITTARYADITAINAIPSPPIGMIVYNNSSNSMWIKTAVGWAELASTVTNNWAIAGNTGTNSASNFIGTIDSQPLIFKTNNTEAMRISNTGNVGIGMTPNSNVTLDVDGSARLQKELIVKELWLHPTVATTYDPLDRVDKSFVTFELSVGVNVTSTIKGFSPPVIGSFTSGSVLFLCNGERGSLILKHDASTISANRILTNTNADVTITGRGGAVFVYDENGWRMIAVAQ